MLWLDSLVTTFASLWQIGITRAVVIRHTENRQQQLKDKNESQQSPMIMMESLLVNQNNNGKIYRRNPSKDCRWRWMVYVAIVIWKTRSTLTMTALRAKQASSVPTTMVHRNTKMFRRHARRLPLRKESIQTGIRKNIAISSWSQKSSMKFSHKANTSLLSSLHHTNAARGLSLSKNSPPPCTQTNYSAATVIAEEEECISLLNNICCSYVKREKPIMHAANKKIM
jgi:hypothetical protein